MLPGVARVRMRGARRYAMRVWIDREALAARQLTVADIEARCAARTSSCRPAGSNRSQREFTLRTETGLNTEQDFRELVIGRGADGYLVRLGEVADVRLAAENERSLSRYQRRARHQLGVEQISKANTLEVRSAVRAEVERIAPDLPAGTRLEVNLDRSVFIEASMNEVVIALADRARAGARRHLPVPRQPARDADPGRHDPGLHHLGVHRHGARSATRSTC